ncbi:MAG: TetR/AcrR family transcriptional regulator [Myxococcota bacterium]
MSPPTSKTPSAPPQRKGDRTALQILDAAEDLFAERGFAGTTLRDVATRVGIQIPSLYNHFESKEALYAAVLERGLEPVLGVLSNLVAESSGQQRPDARPVVQSIMALLDARPHLPRLLLHETLAGGQRLTPVLRDTIGPIFENAQKVTETATQGTRWRTDQVPLLVLALYHVVVGNYTIAPFYEQLTSQDLMSEEAREKRTVFLTDLVETLFAPTSTTDC